MHFRHYYRHLWSAIAVFGAGIAATSVTPAEGLAAAARTATDACAENDSGLKLPPGFCAIRRAGTTWSSKHWQGIARQGDARS
jgi:hypothetical protein